MEFFFHVRNAPNKGIKSNFHGHTTSNGGDYTRQPKMGRILTLIVMGSPLENRDLKNLFYHVRKSETIDFESNFHDHTTTNTKGYSEQPKPKCYH